MKQVGSINPFCPYIHDQQRTQQSIIVVFWVTKKYAPPTGIYRTKTVDGEPKYMCMHNRDM